jgi:hypothetical protein
MLDKSLDNGPAEAPQRPLPDRALRTVATGGKEDPGAATAPDWLTYGRLTGLGPPPAALPPVLG